MTAAAVPRERVGGKMVGIAWRADMGVDASAGN